MSIFKKTDVPVTSAPPTLSERAVRAEARGLDALSTFELAARDLDQAASDLEDLSDEAKQTADAVLEQAQAQAGELRQASDAFTRTAADMLARASKIRELVGA